MFSLVHLMDLGIDSYLDSIYGVFGFYVGIALAVTCASRIERQLDYVERNLIEKGFVP